MTAIRPPTTLDVTSTGVLPEGRRLGLDGRRVPILRGRIHQAAVIPVMLAAATLTITAPRAAGKAAFAVFGVSVAAMLAASAFYHCHAHSASTKLQARRLDHAMIFVAIAGTQTAYWLLAAPATVAAPMIALGWIAAGFGIRHKYRHLSLSTSTGSWLYAALGWMSVAMVPFLVDAGADVLLLVAAGGLVYSVGAAFLVARSVDPWPRVFGYHEVWHLLVVVGVATHGAGIVVLTHGR